MQPANSGSRPLYIDSDQALADVSSSLMDCPQLAFDSEFIRTDTFFPKPGLYQMDNGEQTYLIDPLTISHWESFQQLLKSGATVIMHSCSEDLGLLQHSLQTLPAILFDTQRAAAFVGYDYSLSYQALVKAELDLDLPKGETRSDWLRRPLAGSQLEYAALDVEYLVELRGRLEEKLIRQDRLDWFQNDCRDLLLNVTDEQDSSAWEAAYKNFGSAWQLDTERLQLLQALVYWREATARKRNKPRNWVARDQELQTLAERLPVGGSIGRRDIEQSGVFSPRFLDRYGASLTEFMNQQWIFAEPARPELVSRPLSNRARNQLKSLQKLTRGIAEEIDMSPELLARKRLWIELLSNGKNDDTVSWPAGLDNWRRELLEPGVKKVLGLESK